MLRKEPGSPCGVPREDASVCVATRNRVMVSRYGDGGDSTGLDGCRENQHTKNASISWLGKEKGITYPSCPAQ